jgi:hypothetical protein
MNFVFEHKEEARNFTTGNQQNKTGWNRFCIAPFFNLIRCLSTLSPHYKDMSMMFDINEKPEKFIISTGLHNDPKNWGGGKLSGYENYESLFDLLSDEYIQDIKNNKALLLLDNSLEGFHEDWIFEFLHHECERFDINPSKVIYVTGNLSVSQSYENWLVNNPKEIKIHTFEYPHFQTDVFLFTVHLPKDNDTAPPTFEEQLEYKTKNLNNIKLYSYLNLKPRLHRVHLYYYLYLNNLLDMGLISMEDFGSNGIDFGGNTPNGNPWKETFSDNVINQVQKTLPARIDGKSNREQGVEYVTRFHPKVTLDSWVQVVSETYFYDEYKTLFISEKTFKVIASSQPFIIFGSKGSLKELKKLGYKTFDKWFDESYDDMDDYNRMTAIIKVLKDIEKIENKIEWFSEMKEVLEHNKNLIEKNTLETPPSVFSKVIQLYNKL